MTLNIKDVGTVEKFKVISVKEGKVHWFWWLLWAILFLPMVLVVALWHMYKPSFYTIKVKHVNGEIKVYEYVTQEVINALSLNDEEDW